MKLRALREFGSDQTAAIAPIYALSLFGLIGMAGVGFDYARLMALDTELQNAADQLALAAATQLDEQDDSITRAESAGRNFFASSTSDYTNETRISNIDDGGGDDKRLITSVTFNFYQGYDDQNDQPDTLISPSSGSYTAAQQRSAHVVEAVVGRRSVQFALTPIVGAIAGDAGGSAMATMDTAYCKVPPLMVCQPPSNPNLGAIDASGNIPDRGKGMQLHFLPNGKTDFDDTIDTSTVPGLFGFLEFPYPNPSGNGNPNTSLGWEVPNPGCTDDSVDARAGVRVPEQLALNTRFGIYDKSASGYSCNSATGTFCPSSNASRDLVVDISVNNQSASDIAAYSCPASPPNNANFEKISNFSNLAGYNNERPAGYSRDNCHKSGTCGVIGTTAYDWNFADYMQRVHGFTVTPGDSTTYPSGLSGQARYDVYKWEKAISTRTDPYRAGYRVEAKNNGNTTHYYCAYPRPQEGTPVETPTVRKDRRLLQVASVDCSNVTGKTVTIDRYIDVFLVEPARDSGSQKEFYVEILGEDPNAGSNTTFQQFAKRKAVLIR
ncbi:TadE/TadG family type IV pilus assembly protein [Croceicoccus naphthovorans]|uniref:Uncharacterized protein n=1 Tax=Croceicoccus naphthovorans TaxID=1348774 RepID=A0A0G3XGR2_9SPHN|nr:pilus assembly protein TadG-related protein [Croceicoccus naphthovorans]AKM09533.1 hypothetical protein AB433_05330 [Croceicoccus naphthovorans]MBB3989719.1 Flp pilus assembly protein TadG [Croceicoccus naphthovorans]